MTPPRRPKPNPPRPNKLFLTLAVVLLATWIGFLTVLALLARKWA